MAVFFINTNILINGRIYTPGWETNYCMRSQVGMRTSVFRNLDRSCGSLSHCKDGKWKLAAFTYFKLYKWICVVVFAE